MADQTDLMDILCALHQRGRRITTAQEIAEILFPGSRRENAKGQVFNHASGVAGLMLRRCQAVHEVTWRRWRIIPEYLPTDRVDPQKYDLRKRIELDHLPEGEYILQLRRCLHFYQRNGRINAGRAKAKRGIWALYFIDPNNGTTNVRYIQRLIDGWAQGVVEHFRALATEEPSIGVTEPLDSARPSLVRRLRKEGLRVRILNKGQKVDASSAPLPDKFIETVQSILAARGEAALEFRELDEVIGNKGFIPLPAHTHWGRRGSTASPFVRYCQDVVNNLIKAREADKPPRTVEARAPDPDWVRQRAAEYTRLMRLAELHLEQLRDPDLYVAEFMDDRGEPLPPDPLLSGFAESLKYLRKSNIGEQPVSLEELMTIEVSGNSGIDRDNWAAECMPPPDEPGGKWSPWLAAHSLETLCGPRGHRPILGKVPVLLASIRGLPLEAAVAEKLSHSGVRYIGQVVQLSREEALEAGHISPEMEARLDGILQFFGLDFGASLSGWKGCIHRAPFLPHQAQAEKTSWTDDEKVDIYLRFRAGQSFKYIGEVLGKSEVRVRKLMRMGRDIYWNRRDSRLEYNR